LLATYCFIASLHTTQNIFRLILRRLSLYFHVFYFVLNAYVLWWSENDIRFFSNSYTTCLIRVHAIIAFLISGGFCLDKFLVRTCQCAMYFISFQICFDLLILYHMQQSSVHFWLLIDYIIDDIALLCGHFYFYQFNRYQTIKSNKNN
jgi:hypothetical protein